MFHYDHNNDMIPLEKVPLELVTVSSSVPQNESEGKRTFGQVLSEAIEFSKSLYKWSNVDIVLPKSVFCDNGDLKGLFVLPDFEENYNRKLSKHLSHNQLQSIKRRGTFMIPSHNFPGQFHTWKLNELFQKGSERARDELLDGVAFSLRFVTVYLPQLVLREFSVKSGVTSFFKLLYEVFDLLVGLGKSTTRNLERRIQEERCKFLVAELKCNKGDYERYCKELANYIRSQVNKAMKERVMAVVKKPPPIPYRFVTPQGMDVDLRLFDRNLLRKASPHLIKLLERCNRQTDGWFLSYREKVIRKSCDEFESNRLIMEEFLTRLYNSIRSCEAIKELDIDRVLIQQAQLTIVMQRSLDRVLNHELSSYLKSEEKNLCGGYPLLSRDKRWLRMQMTRVENKFYEENQFLGYEIAIQLCKEDFLQQGCYFIHRDLLFQRDTAPVLRKELESQRTPTRVYIWRTVYSKELGSSSSGALYRMRNVIYRTMILFMNMLYLFGWWFPFNSKLSLRTLVSKNYENSLVAWFNKIWRNVSKSRSRFETSHSPGFFGKSFSRAVNLFYSYLLLGVGPSIVLGVLAPVVILLGIVICLFVVVTSFFWAPMLSVCFHVVCVLIYDFDSPDEEEYKLFRLFQILFLLLVKGILQPLICALSAFVFCPLICAIISAVSLVKYGCRLWWDGVIYHLLIKQKGRLPSQNSWIVKRLSQPPFLLEITPPQALLALLSRLEQEELTFYYKWMLKTLQKPLELYETFHRQFLKPLSVNLDTSAELGPYKSLINETVGHRNILEEKIMGRKQLLQLGLSVNNRSLMRMKKGELEKTLLAGRRIVSEFYANVFGKYDVEGGFWEQRGLNNRDFTNLTMVLFGEVFCQEFLCPLAVGDVVFPVEMGYKAPVQLLESLNSIMEEEVLNLDKPIMTMSKVNYKIHSPYLGIEAFSPFSSEHCQRDELYLPIPPPILHPVYISVIIFNREEQDPHYFIDYEKPVCQAILRAIQDCGPSVMQDCISLDLSTSSSSSGSKSEDEDEDEEPEEVTSMIGNSKASLAEAEEINLDCELSLTSYLGTSV